MEEDCPYCGSDDVISYIDNMKYIRFVCHNCSETWKDLVSNYAKV